MIAYEWDEFKDHIWLAVDCCQNVAVFTCSVAKGLPYWIQVPDSEMQNVDEELSTLPSFAQIEGITDQVLYIESHGSESCNFPRSWDLKGLFY